MKILGTHQFLSKTYKLLPIPEKWKGVLGEIEDTFIGIIFGRQGNGKTDFCVQLARMLADISDVAWLDYEEQHRGTLQRAVRRNNCSSSKHPIKWINPLEKVPAGFSIYEWLDKYLSKRGTPRFVLINSLDYLRLSMDQYYELSRKYRNKKCIIFIGHAKGKEQASAVGRKVAYDGDFEIFVSKFIADPFKSRFGAIDKFVIWEERARQLNPLHFAQEEVQVVKKKRGPKPKAKAVPQIIPIIHEQN